MLTNSVLFTVMPQPFTECPSILMLQGAAYPASAGDQDPFRAQAPEPSSPPVPRRGAAAVTGRPGLILSSRSHSGSLFPMEFLQCPDPERQGTNTQAPGLEQSPPIGTDGQKGIAGCAFTYACVQSLICWFIHLKTYLFEHLLSAGLSSRYWGFSSETSRRILALLEGTVR